MKLRIRILHTGWPICALGGGLTLGQYLGNHTPWILDAAIAMILLSFVFMLAESKMIYDQDKAEMNQRFARWEASHDPTRPTQ